MRRELPSEKGDITSETIKDNDTWNECPDCRATWKDMVATPGIIYRFKLCRRCSDKTNSRSHS